MTTGKTPESHGDSMLVSCIVAAFNSAAHVSEAIDSILAQRHRPIEIIVVDGGSTDGTQAVVSAFGDPVRLVALPNAGPTQARNKGIAEAKGNFLAFLDADDRWHPEKLTFQMARFASRPELDACVGLVQNDYAPGMEAERDLFRDHWRSRPVPGFVTATLLVKQAFLERVGHLREDLWCADSADWFLRARAAGGTIEMLPDVLVFHRVHSSNLSRRQIGRSREEFLDLLKAKLDRDRKPA
jgi:glycosyltransferase involved in cell wall biosynthesis